MSISEIIVLYIIGFYSSEKAKRMEINHPKEALNEDAVIIEMEKLRSDWKIYEKRGASPFRKQA